VNSESLKRSTSWRFTDLAATYRGRFMQFRRRLSEADLERLNEELAKLRDAQQTERNAEQQARIQNQISNIVYGRNPDGYSPIGDRNGQFAGGKITPY
jgi:hypothetical protein